MRQEATYRVQCSPGLAAAVLRKKNALQISFRLAKAVKLHLGLALRGRVTIQII